MSRYITNPSLEQWNAIERIFKYLKGKVNDGISYSRFLNVLEGYNITNWTSNFNETKANSGFVFTLVDGAIAWQSFK